MLTVSPRLAADFLEQLEVFSAEVRALWVGSKDYSPYGEPKYRPVQNELLPSGAAGPAGAIIHYTAGPTARSAVQTFCDPKLGNGRSAHLVIERAWPASVRALPVLRDCPLVAALPVMPVLCRRLQAETVHATWANRWSIGCELVSWGKLAIDNRVTPTLEAWGARWQPILAEQLATTVAVLGYVATLYPAFSPSWVFGHEQVQTQVTLGCGGENKVDPGPLVDLSDLRRRLRGPQAQAAVASTPPVTTGRPDMEAWRLLRALGYWDGGPGARPLAVFQYAMNLVVDGLMGPKSKAAMLARLRDRMGTDAEAVIERCRNLA